MFGRYVDGEIDTAVKTCKTDKQAELKVKMLMRRILEGDLPPENGQPIADDPEGVVLPMKGRFKDPASQFGKS